jgi:hypothetical protein
MAQQTPERGGFKLGAGSVIQRLHDVLSLYRAALPAA